MKKFNRIDYKGKYFIIEDKNMYDAMDFIVGTIEKSETLKEDFIINHKENCRYYGIPPYIGKDKDLNKIYK